VVLGRPAIRIVFEHGKFDAAAGDLTADVLKAYAVALPAYVVAEVISRGLIAMRGTRTPLMTNMAQLGGCALIIALLIHSRGAVAIPIALAVSASVETVVLGTVLAVKLRGRERAARRTRATAAGA